MTFFPPGRTILPLFTVIVWSLGIATDSTQKEQLPVSLLGAAAAPLLFHVFDLLTGLVRQLARLLQRFLAKLARLLPGTHVDGFSVGLKSGAARSRSFDSGTVTTRFPSAAAAIESVP